LKCGLRKRLLGGYAESVILSRSRTLPTLRETHRPRARLFHGPGDIPRLRTARHKDIGSHEQ